MLSETAHAGADALRIHLLGGFRVLLGTQVLPEDAWRLQRAKTLVKMLALAREHRLHREQALELLWPDGALKDSNNSLHQVLHAVRSAFEQATATAPNYVHLQGDMLLFTSEQALWIDVEAFESAAARARLSQNPAAYRAALALYTGDLLPEDRYEDWASSRRNLLRQTHLGLMLDLVRLLEAQRAYQEAIACLETLFRLDPTNEEAHAVFMRLQALTGHPQTALAYYQTLERILQQEVGATPQPSTRRLFEDIRAGRFPPADQRYPPGPQENMLPAKALMHSPRPESLGKPTPGNHAAYATNLPIQVSSFVGRAHELAEVGNLLKRFRLITITGVGGSGKTRLALQVADHLLQQFLDGVWLIELAGVQQAALVPEVVAQTLSLPEQSGRPVLETLIAFLKTKHVLLLLDNCEHLVESCATLAQSLGEACPQVHLLCTSREPLHIPGEVLWRISSLALPDVRQGAGPEAISRCESVQLFVDRARAVLPGFSLTEQNALSVAQICCRLDGLPLALELAAARVAALSVAQIVERLDNCFSLLTTGSRTALTRQQTLKATLDWSHDLLSAAERALFRRLAVFAGGFDLAAAEVVGAGEGVEVGEVLDLLTGLVDKSLVVAEEQESQMRYRLLEPVRQYAEYWLASSGETRQARKQHRDWYLHFVEQADAGLWGERHTFWVAYLEQELDNVRAALGWCLREPGEAMPGLALAGVLWQFWLLRGYLAEGRRWLELLLAQAPEPTAARAAMLLYVYTFTLRQAEYAAAAVQAHVEESLSIARALQDTQSTSLALHMYGIQAYMVGDFERARTSFSESLTLARTHERVAERAFATYSLGVLAWAQGDFPLAWECLEESASLLRRVDNQPHLTRCLPNLATLELPFGDSGQALLVDEETWVVLRAMNTSTMLGYVLANLGTLARLEDDMDRAHAYMEEGKALFEQIGDKAGLSQMLGQLGNLHRSAQRFDQARSFLEQSLSLRRELGDRRGIGRTLNNLGLLAMAAGDFQQARALYEQSMALFAAMGDTVGIMATLDNQGHLALFEHNFEHARLLYTERLGYSRRLGDIKRGEAVPLRHLGIVAQALGDHSAARANYEACLARLTHLGDQRGAARLRHLLETLGQEQHNADQAEFPSST